MTEHEFYELYENETWSACHCGQIVSGKPHYRDAEDENDYFICPICYRKLYIKE